MRAPRSTWRNVLILAVRTEPPSNRAHRRRALARAPRTPRARWRPWDSFLFLGRGSRSFARAIDAGACGNATSARGLALHSSRSHVCRRPSARLLP
eukprot:29991-Pelagococcus_subviridis.AAC.1